MHIERLRIKNFRSFREVDVTLPPLSVVVGANASGKSNFVQVFRFLRDLAREGLDNAVALQGGIDYLRNLRIGHSEPLEITVSVSEPKPPFRFDYELQLTFSKRGKRFRIEREFLRSEETIPIRLLHKGKPEADESETKPVNRQITIERHRERLRIKVAPPMRRPTRPAHEPVSGLMETELQAIGQELRQLFTETTETIERSRSILTIPVLGLQGRILRRFTDIAIYDLNPKILKQATPLKGRAFLEEDGSNLAVVLREILRHKEFRQELLAHLQRFLPFIEDIQVQNLVDRSVFIQMYERYLHDQPIPSALLSDGTVELVALIVALYFTPSGVVVFEEPERNLHPFLISRLMEMFLEVAESRQVIFTTHNPEVVRHTPLESLLLVSRDTEGFSTLTCPAEQEMVKTFLEEELGLDELFVENLLGA